MRIQPDAGARAGIRVVSTRELVELVEASYNQAQAVCLSRVGAPAGDPIGFPCFEPAGRSLARSLSGRAPLFACVVGHTDTCLMPGISAAGVTPNARQFTPAADAEVLVHGSARCLKGVPSSPVGPPGPAIITLAALREAQTPCVIVDAGTRIRPQAPSVVLGVDPGRDITRGRAVPRAARLFARGRELGRMLGGRAPYLVLGESVPAGTTTALAVLLGLGYPALGKVSSSMSENNHALKEQVVTRALRAAGLEYETAAGKRREVPDRAQGYPPPASRDPLEVLARVGDPMQPALAGIALGALERCPVLLAGGTQMVAVLAVMRAVLGTEGSELPTERLAIATTRWVVDDPTSDFSGLLRMVAPVPALCTMLSFAESAHAPLRQYEAFLVKEGVGAGGAAVAASLARNLGVKDLRDASERVFRRLIGA